MKHTRNTQSGFTLIELLVSISIIGVISSIVLMSVSSARASGNDARRSADLDSVYSALELFHAAYGRYPSSADGSCNHNTSFLSGGCLEILVTAGYLPTLPKDPKAGWQYYYDNWCNVGGSGNQVFRMWSEGETTNNGLAENWWTQNNIGHTTCQDPS